MLKYISINCCVDLVRQIRAQLMKNSFKSALGSSLAASKAQLKPPASATFSLTTSFPFTLPPAKSKPSNSSIIA